MIECLIIYLVESPNELSDSDSSVSLKFQRDLSVAAVRERPQRNSARESINKLATYFVDDSTSIDDDEVGRIQMAFQPVCFNNPVLGVGQVFPHRIESNKHMLVTARLVTVHH